VDVRFRRAEVLSAQANGITLLVISALVAFEAISRLVRPLPVPGLYRRAVRLEQFSIGWMLIEAGVAITAGTIAGSLALTSFGYDSVIELISATWSCARLRAELSGGRADEQAERRVLRIIAVTFFVLAAYVLAGSVIDLTSHAHPERSPIGIGLTVSSLLVMPLLGWQTARRIGFAQPDGPGRRRRDHPVCHPGRHDPGRARPGRNVRLVAG
jgi:divalent metal cation (Fe/Co/Zn/Cd) transporter